MSLPEPVSDEPLPPPADTPLDPADARRARLRAAAIDAERATGEWEATEVEVKRHIVVRLAVIALGSLVTLAGIAMLIAPGPGLVVVIAGLGILATEVSWAERLLAYAKSKARIEEVTAQRPWVKPVSIAITVIAVVVSLLYAVRWR